MNKIKYVVLLVIALLLFPSTIQATMIVNDTNTTISTQVPTTHEIELQTDGNGTVFYDGIATTHMVVERLSMPKVLIRGESGYSIKEVMLNNQDVTHRVVGGYFTFEEVHDDAVLKVRFQKETDREARFIFVGTVYRNGSPLANRQVELRSKLKTFQTTNQGRFSFSDVEDGFHSFTVVEDGTIIGYTEFTLIRDDAIATIELSKNPQGAYEIRVHKQYAILNLEFHILEDGTIEIKNAIATNDKDAIAKFPPTGEAVPYPSLVMSTAASFGVILLLFIGKKRKADRK